MVVWGACGLWRRAKGITSSPSPSASAYCGERTWINSRAFSPQTGDPTPNHMMSGGSGN